MKFKAIIFVGVYILLRMIADPFFWQGVSEYYSYTFEIAFVAAVYFVYRHKVTLWKRLTASDGIFTAAMVGVGFCVFKAAGLFQISIPFDLSSGVLILLLLVVGPVLEELIFRMALWEPIEVLCGNDKATLLATTLLFAIGHLTSYYSVPEQFHSFIIYQTIYVTLLGLVAGARRLRTKAVSPSLYLHIGFNLGFFLGSLL